MEIIHRRPQNSEGKALHSFCTLINIKHMMVYKTVVWNCGLGRLNQTKYNNLVYTSKTCNHLVIIEILQPSNWSNFMHNDSRSNPWQPTTISINSLAPFQFQFQFQFQLFLKNVILLKPSCIASQPEKKNSHNSSLMHVYSVLHYWTWTEQNCSKICMEIHDHWSDWKETSLSYKTVQAQTWLLQKHEYRASTTLIAGQK